MVSPEEEKKEEYAKPRKERSELWEDRAYDCGCNSWSPLRNSVGSFKKKTHPPISIAIDNGRNNTVGGGCYSAHQAVSKFAEQNIDMVS